jgi:hypothetical protein
MPLDLVEYALRHVIHALGLLIQAKKAVRVGVVLVCRAHPCAVGACAPTAVRCLTS